MRLCISVYSSLSFFVSLILLGAGCRTDVPRTACDHPFYPLRPGYEVRYRTTFPSIDGGASSGGYTVRVNRATSGSAQLDILFDDEAPGQTAIVTKQDIRCTPDGLQALSFVDIGSRIQGGMAANQFQVTTTRSSGELLPRDIRIGSSWSSAFDVTISTQQDPTTLPESTPFRQPMTIPIEIQRRAIAQERIRVEAGEYEAVKIEAKTVMNGQVAMSGNEWWVKEVGMVKSTYDAGSATQSILTEAINVTVPRR